jgi:hypothetical protein
MAEEPKTSQASPDPLDKISQRDFTTIAGDRFMQGIIKGIADHGDPDHYLKRLTDEDVDWRLSKLSEAGVIFHHISKNGTYWPKYTPNTYTWRLTKPGIRVYQELKLSQKPHTEAWTWTT